VARCNACASFPWKPGADLSYLPAVRCHESLPIRRWTPESAAAEHDCPCFKGKGGAKPKPKPEDPPADSPVKPGVGQPVDPSANTQKGEAEGNSGQAPVTGGEGQASVTAGTVTNEADQKIEAMLDGMKLAGSNWYQLSPEGPKVNGRKAARAKLVELLGKVKPDDANGGAPDPPA
jgi:hypothetical protein